MRLTAIFSLAIAGGLLSTSARPQPPAGVDPLPSWNDTPAKKAITAFVTKVTREGSSDFVTPTERIAVFDNDGTLWCEKPMPIQADFILRRLFEMAEADPGLRDRQPWKAAYGRDHGWLGNVLAQHYAGDDSNVHTLLGHNWRMSEPHAAIVEALNSPDVKDKLAPQGAVLIGGTPEEFTAYILAETASGDIEVDGVFYLFFIKNHLFCSGIDGRHAHHHQLPDLLVFTKCAEHAVYPFVGGRGAGLLAKAVHGRHQEDQAPEGLHIHTGFKACLFVVNCNTN